MITIGDILRPEDIDLDLKMSNQEEAINHVAALLREDERVIDWGVFYQGLSSKQPCIAAVGGTEICIPHTRTESVAGMVVAAGRSQAGISIREADGLIYFVFVIGVPVALAADYLRIIGALTRIFKETAQRDRLRQAATPEEFLQILIHAEMKL